MKLFRMMMKFLELCKWFNRKSQHYILGDWLKYVSSWDYKNQCWNKAYFNYLFGYPRAWVRFMWFSKDELWNA